jgi:hypothetical protein
MAGENQNTGASSLPGGQSNAGSNMSGRDVSGIAKSVIKDQGDFNDLIRDSVRELDKVDRAYEKIRAKIEAANTLNKDIKSIEVDILKSLQAELKIKNQLQSIDSDTQKSATEKLQKIAQLREKEKEQAKELQTLTLANLDSQKEKRENLTQQLNQTAALLDVEEKSLSVEEARYIALVKALQVAEKSTDEYKEQAEYQKEINRRMGATGQLAKGLAGVVDKLGLGGFLQIDNTIEKMRIAAADGKSKWSIFGIAMKDTFQAVGKALMNPLAILGMMYSIMKKLVTSAIEYQDKVFAAGKALGMNLTQAKGLFNQFQNIAMANGRLAMTAKQLVETYSQMNSNLGFMGPKNAEFLTVTTGIQRRIGATAEDMQSLQYFSAKTGASLQSSYASIIGSAKATAAKLKIDMTEKQILEGISKVSATIFNNFKGNVKQIAAAVVTATKLGVTLDQIASAGSNLLDFESSISKEFEAQLLTGRDLDLSKARELALNGKNSELMTELTNKLGTYTQWNEMNVLQQQSYAEALGMSKEMVDEIYRKQELANALGAQAGADLQTQYKLLRDKGKTHEQIVGLMGQQSASDALSASASERMQATMERVNDTIGRAAQALMPMIEKVATLAEKFALFVGSGDNLRKILGVTAGILTGMLTTSIALGFQKRAALATDMQARLVNNQLLATSILQKNGDATRLVTNRGIVLIKKAQNIETTTGIAKAQIQQIAETGIARTRIIGAGASAAAGAGWMGPLALGVGAAVIAGLMAYMGSGGGGASSGGGMSAPITPMNSNVANATAVEKAATPNKISTGGAKSDQSLNVIMNVDGVQFGKVVTNSLSKNATVASGDQTVINPGP